MTECGIQKKIASVFRATFFNLNLTRFLRFYGNDADFLEEGNVVEDHSLTRFFYQNNVDSRAYYNHYSSLYMSHNCNQMKTANQN